MDPTNAPFFVDNEVIQLTKNGVWIADGTEITHEPTRKLFARSLVRDSKGGYSLVIGRETKAIEVEDTAHFVIRVDGTPKLGVSLTLSNETQEPLQPGTLNYRPGRLTCLIKNGTEEAKFLHAPYFDLLKHLEEDSNAYYLKFGTKRFDIAPKKEPK